MAAGTRNADHRPREVTKVPHRTRVPHAFGLRDPSTSAAIYKEETRHEGEAPEGSYIFQRGRKRLNYIFKRHRRAEEYQQRLGPEAEMPRMSIWKINTAELGTVAFVCFLPGAAESWGGERPGGSGGRASQDGNAPLPLACILLQRDTCYRPREPPVTPLPLRTGLSSFPGCGGLRTDVASSSVFVPLSHGDGAPAASCPRPCAGDSGGR